MQLLQELDPSCALETRWTSDEASRRSGRAELGNSLPPIEVLRPMQGCPRPPKIKQPDDLEKKAWLAWALESKNSASTLALCGCTGFPWPSM
jgi:hypothetical protein